jgi:hypothetical protein
VYFGLSGVSERASRCNADHGCSSSTYDEIQRSYVAADVAMAVAVLALAGAAWLYLTRTRADRPRLGALVVPW